MDTGVVIAPTARSLPAPPVNGQGSHRATHRAVLFSRFMMPGTDPEQGGMTFSASTTPDVLDAPG